METQHNIITLAKDHLINYPTPANLSYFWGFGFLSAMCLIIQIVSGLFLAMHYTPHVILAFDSVEHIMRDVNNGSFFRYLHANGASAFFIVLYCHIGRGLYYRSYAFPRTHVWYSGITLYILVMATAFLGYVLPWGQMSYWGATVITKLFSAIPIVGNKIAYWLWGGFSVDNATLNRFFVLHFILPFGIAAGSILHIALLHKVGSNNPLGIQSYDNLSFYPYFIIKDFFAFFCFLFILFYFVWMAPDELGHPDNYIRANPESTPAHIVPEWYFLPFYAILRAVPNKLGGVVLMGCAIAILYLLPTLDNIAPFNSPRFRPLFEFFFWTFIFTFLLLGFLGGQPVEEPYTQISVILTIYYFSFFLVIVPVIGLFEFEFFNYTLSNTKN